VCVEFMHLDFDDVLRSAHWSRSGPSRGQGKAAAMRARLPYKAPLHPPQKTDQGHPRNMDVPTHIEVEDGHPSFVDARSSASRATARRTDGAETKTHIFFCQTNFVQNAQTVRLWVVVFYARCSAV
jgi:hypothetical protein